MSSHLHLDGEQALGGWEGVSKLRVEAGEQLRVTIEPTLGAVSCLSRQAHRQEVLRVAIPKFHEMLRPILALSAQEPIMRHVATAAMGRHFGLTVAECEERIPSGGTTLLHGRAGWAMTYLTKAGLIEKVAPKTYAISSRGRDFLLQHPNDISLADLKDVDGWAEAWGSGKKGDGAVSGLPELDSSPAEVIGEAIKALNADLKQRLMERILRQDPEFFERLVLDVLIKMGYGGSREEAAEHLGQSGDEGIDGRISQDALGLDQILVQAKRYAPDRPIDRKTIQAFIGSLAGQGVSKGIFITTSSYAATAREFVQRGSQTKIVLIDGEDLLNHMMRWKVGVRVERSIDLLEVDQNYFDTQD